MKKEKTPKQLLKENEDLRIRLQEAEDTLQAIREGAVDAVIVSGPKGEKIFTLTGEEQIYRRLVETMGEAGLTTTPEGKILFCNRQFSEMLGLAMEEIVGQDIQRFVKISDRKNMAAMLKKAQVEPTRRRLVFAAADGSFVPAWVAANLLEYNDSVSICIVAMDQTELEASKEAMRQIAEQKEELRAQQEELIAQQEELRSQNDQLTESEADLHKLNRVLRALSSSNQAMMRAVDETHYLQEVCKVIDKDCGYTMVWIGYAQDDAAKSVRPMASAGFDEEYLKTLNITWADTERGRGPTGKAIRAGKVSMCRNMLTDPAFEPWRQEAMKRGYASSIVFPLIEGGRVFGALSIYSSEADPFTKEEVNLLGELASDLAYGITAIRSRIARDKAEESIKRQSAILGAINQIFEEAISSGTEDSLGEKCLKIATEVTQSKFGFIGRITEKGLEDIAISNPGWDACKTMSADGHCNRGGTFKIHGIYSRVIKDGKSLFTNDLASHPDSIGLTKDHPPMQSFLGTPLIYNGKTIGMVAVSNRPGGYTQGQQDALEAIAPAIVESLMRKRAEEKQKEIAEELERSNRDLEQFAYVASHDLREPLRAISGFAGLLGVRFNDKLDDKGREYIKLTADSANRMDDLLTGLLAYSRVQTHGKKPAQIPAQIALKAAIANLRASIQETGAVITVDDLPTVMADGMQLTQLFQNLIANAVKFHGDKKPEIYIGCQKEGDFQQFSVRDNGIGIDPQFNERIFVIFQRLHTRDKYPGYGIGLSICKRIVDRHGGKIWVESQVGQGTTFYFTIPQ